MNWIVEDGDHKGCGKDKNYTVRRVGIQWIIAACDHYGGGFPVIFEETFMLAGYAKQYVENIEAMRAAA